MCGRNICILKKELPLISITSLGKETCVNDKQLYKDRFPRSFIFVSNHIQRMALQREQSTFYRVFLLFPPKTKCDTYI